MCNAIHYSYCVYIIVYVLSLFTYAQMFFYICKYADIHLHIALSSPRFNMYNRDIFIQETYYGGNSRLCLIIFLFARLSVKILCTE